MHGFIVLRHVLFEAEYEVTTSPSIYERVILRDISVTTVTQSHVCTETTGLGMERYHVALESGIGSQHKWNMINALLISL